MKIDPPSHEVIEPIRMADLTKGLVVPRPDFERWLERWDWTYHQIARGEFPMGFDDLTQFQLGAIVADPVLWVAAFLRNPDDPQCPYTFWDYQKESIRYGGDTLHECGAEVGKTREIIAVILWRAFTCTGGSGLVTAPMFVHLLEIIDAINEQLSFNPDLARARILHRKHPHHHMKFSNRFAIDFRPAGYDGESLRGVHVKTFAIFDETTKAKNPNIFKEFWRATKPGCVHKLYSTPDGDRSCNFYKLCAKADGRTLESEDAPDDEINGKDIEWRKFHWSKELMPSPFWTDRRRRFYIDQYGGEDSPGYQQNVLGNWGDPENSVFPWHSFSRLLKDIPEYLVLKVLVDDSQGVVTVNGARYVRGESDDQPVEDILVEDRLKKTEFDLSTTIRRFFRAMPGLFFGGADLGFSQDPTEIYIKQVVGQTHRLVARLQLKGVTYDQQAAAITAMDDLFDPGTNTMGWGIDYGNAGSAVVHMLHNLEQFESKNFEDRVTGYQFGATYEAVNEDGQVMLDRHTQKPMKLTAKELATDLLVSKMQRLQLEYPYDPDLILDYPNHTYRQGARSRIFKNEDDHTIDADRVLSLRIILPGANREDIFA